MAKVLEPCGTNAAYIRHVRRKEDACVPCREAHGRYNAARSMARQRALIRLSHEYPFLFRDLYAEELERLGVKRARGAV